MTAAWLNPDDDMVAAGIDGMAAIMHALDDSRTEADVLRAVDPLLDGDRDVLAMVLMTAVTHLAGILTASANRRGIPYPVAVVEWVSHASMAANVVRLDTEEGGS